MKRNTVLTVTLLVVIVGTAFGCAGSKTTSAAPGEFGALATSDQPVNLDQLPPSVRRTVEEHRDGGAVTEIEQSKAGGQVVYEIEIQRDGEEFDFAVAVDGAFLGYEDDDGPGDDDGPDDDDGPGDDDGPDDED